MKLTMLFAPDAAYFKRREREELLAARSATNPQVVAVHLELAEAYGRLAAQDTPRQLSS